MIPFSFPYQITCTYGRENDTQEQRIYSVVCNLLTNVRSSSGLTLDNSLLGYDTLNCVTSKLHLNAISQYPANLVTHFVLITARCWYRVPESESIVNHPQGKEIRNADTPQGYCWTGMKPARSSANTWTESVRLIKFWRSKVHSTLRIGSPAEVTNIKGKENIYDEEGT